jgi:hypothetical protein
MSTLLKTAAMTLLSKTLQTFLYKYLSDVDVEGVALPSVYDGSGWGVRLSNVKLREGVQLMKELPGKVKKKRRRKKTKKKEEQRDGKKKNANVSNQQQQQQQQQQQHTNNNQVRRQNGKQQHSSFHPVDPEEEQIMDGSLHVGDFQRTASSKDYIEEDDDDAPVTPEQNSKSIFSCFQASRSAVQNTGNNDDGGDQQQQPRSLPEISLHGNNANNANNKTAEKSQPPVRVESELTFDDESFGNNTETADLVHRIDAALEDETREEEYEYEYEYEYGDEEYEEEEEEEEFEEYEQQLKLVLGENGRIGTLDIR